MTVQELIDELQFLSPDAEVRIAQQPSWPLEYRLDGVIEVTNPKDDDDEDEDDQPNIPKDEDENVVYLTEGSQMGYLPGKVSRELGWR
jgi:hypothetical protein